MLGKAQIARLIALALALWAVAALYIRLLPGAFTDPVAGAVGFATTLPMAWLSVWLVRRLGGLTLPQLLPGVALVGAVAMMVDGAALRFAPGVYGDGDLVVRLGAAWLLWGYGVSLAVALVWARRSA